MVVVLALGIMFQGLVRNPVFLWSGGLRSGADRDGHLAFNQYKNLSTQTPNEGQENDGEERSEDGFDD